MDSCPLIPADWDMPDVLRFRLGYGPGRQRAIDSDGHLLLILHEVPKPHDRQRIGQLFWREPDGTWHSAASEDGPKGLERHLKVFESAIDKLSDDLEPAVDSAGYFRILAALGPLGRSTRNMYAALQDARKLYRDDQQLLNWRDTAYDLVRQVELLQDDAQAALNFEIARQTEVQAEASHQMAASAHRLNVLAAFFFPVVTLSAVFGVGLSHGIEVWKSPTGPWGLVAMLMLGVGMGIILTCVITRPAARPEIRNPEEA